MSAPSVITIDGPAGAGKSTLGELLARRLGYLFFDTGVMYRALAWAVLRHSINPEDDEAVAALVRRLDIHVQPPGDATDGRPYTVLVNGVDVTWELRHPEVERMFRSRRDTRRCAPTCATGSVRLVGAGAW